MPEQTQLIDTHGHLNFEAFSQSWEMVADRALAQGVEAIVMPGAQLPTSRRAVELARARPGRLYAAIGLHPIHVPPTGLTPADPAFAEQKFEDFSAGAYRRLAEDPAVVAIGEVGLDTYRTVATVDEQETVLRAFVEIAQAAGKPMILHCRGAKKPGQPSVGPDPHDRLAALLADLPARPAFVVHCYQGTAGQAARYLDLGGLISLTGTITYSDEPAVRDVVASLPLDRLMIETDSPYLSPVPYRGEQNEPWKVAEVARRIAVIKNIALEEVAAVTTQTARRFFGLQVGRQ